MRTIMTNIDQKDNENKELYSNNNLKITQMDRNKNIAASGSELETLQNQYLATKIALENNQEPKKQQKLTQACNKARKALEKYYYEQNLPMLPLQIHEMTEDEDTLLIQKTKIGMAMRAVSRDFETAQLMGIKINSVISVTFVIGSLLAGVASILYFSNYGQVSPMIGAMPGLKAFVAAVFGGIGSIPGAVIGAFIIGICESLIKSNADMAVFSNAFTFALLIVILLCKPNGLFGEKLTEKG